MFNVRFDKEALNITIRNLYPGLELMSPVYFSNGTTCHVSHSQQTDTSNPIEASFGIDSRQGDFKAVLLYKLQRKYITKTDDRSGSSIASIENTNIYLLVVWNVENERDEFYACLIECPADDFTWNEDKLWALHRQYNDQFLKNYKYKTISWLMYGDTVIETRCSATYGLDYKLDIAISEETGKYNMDEPIQIDPKRLVSLLSILIVLMYAVSIPIEPSFKLNIYNRCSTIDLLSPAYITHGWSKCCRAPNYRVCTGDIMRSGFIIKSDNEFDGALIYKLQKKQLHKSTENNRDTSSAVQLLVVWRIAEFKVLYADILLVKHDKRLDKDNLRELYHGNFCRFRLCPDATTETWSLDGNTGLLTAFNTTYRENLILNITISEVEREITMREYQHILIQKGEWHYKHDGCYYPNILSVSSCDCQHV
jgi:hypothetical protein